MIFLEKLYNTTLGSGKPPFRLVLVREGKVKAI